VEKLRKESKKRRKRVKRKEVEINFPLFLSFPFSPFLFPFPFPPFSFPLLLG